MLYCRVNTVTITCTTTCTRRAIFEKMPLPSLHQWPSIWFKFQDSTTVYPQADDSSHWFPFYTWQHSFKFCKICSNAFMSIATFWSGFICFRGGWRLGVVSLSLFMKPLNCSAIYIILLFVLLAYWNSWFHLLQPTPTPTTTNFIFSLPPTPLPPQKHTTHPS